MSVEGINTNLALMQSALEDTRRMDTGVSFASLLSEAVLAAQSGDEQAQGTDIYQQLLGSNSAYGLLSWLLGSGISANPNMALLSLGSALYGGGAAGSGGTTAGVTAGILAGATASQGTTAAGDGVIPASASIPTSPAITSDADYRSAQQYSTVINQFSVETSDRYSTEKGSTYCNIFVWDVTSAMGAEIPHYYNAATGEPMSYGDKGASEMTANAMDGWLHNYGSQYGWYEVTAEQAQNLANEGHPVVTSLPKSGGHGHVQVVCPSRDGVYDEQRGVTIAQAGRRLTSYKPITQIYNASLPKVSYFAHI